MTTQPPGGPDRFGDGAAVLGERYEVGALIGRGGMADVRAGHDTRLGRTVAIKRLRSDLAIDPTFQARFRREAQAAASLNHPSIVAVYDTGEEVVADGTHVPYIVMEHVEGKTLRELLRGGGKILPERALEITADVLSALDYSHRAGIVHRDIKPANVMLTLAGRVKVMDFGIARAIADSSATMTATAAVLGTAQYLSPEQARGEQVDARSDIYSTGCLLFELLAGRPPFQGDSPVSVAYQHVREEPPTPSSLEPDVGPEIDAIVAKSLAKKTSERYQSAAQMRADIERALAGQVVDAATTAIPPVAVPPSSPAQETSFLPEQDDAEPTRSRAWIWVLLVLVLLLALGIGAYALVNGGGDEPGADISVPGVVGDQEQEAVRTVENADLVADTERINSDDPKGQVVDQDPDEGDMLSAGDTVTLTVSAGPDSVAVPNLAGFSRAAAEAKLEARNLVAADAVVREPSDDPQGIVQSSDPPAGEEVDPGTEVVLTVSQGPVLVPELVGDTQEEAEQKLLGLDLRPFVTEQESDQEAGTVIEQDPAPNTPVSPGDQVAIVVAVEPATTPPTTTTPPPTTTAPPTTEPTPTTTPIEPTTTQPGGGPPSTPPGGGPPNTPPAPARQAGAESGSA